MGSGDGLEAVVAAHREDPSFPNTCVCETIAHRDEGHYAKHLAAALAAHLEAVAGDAEAECERLWSVVGRVSALADEWERVSPAWIDPVGGPVIELRAALEGR